VVLEEELSGFELLKISVVWLFSQLDSSELQRHHQPSPQWPFQGISSSHNQGAGYFHVMRLRRGSMPFSLYVLRLTRTFKYRM
jgi:hypothetical protein